MEEMTRLSQSIITEMEETRQPSLPFLDPLKVLKTRRREEEVSDTVQMRNLREEQLHAQSSVMIDLASQKKYVIPSHVTVNQKKLYQL